MNYWLVKTEPEVYSIDRLKNDKKTAWDAVRNYQARNYLKSMKKGDLVFVYHSNCEPPGIAGLAIVVKEAYPELLQFDKKSDYFDSKASKDDPRWFSPDLAFKNKFDRVLALAELKEQSILAKMPLLQRGSRLSVQPVSEIEFACIMKLVN